MKRTYIYILILSVVLLGVAAVLLMIVNDSVEEQNVDDGIIDIVNADGVGMCVDVVEYFHVDRELKYYFPCVMAEGLEVLYGNGETKKFLDVFPEEVTLADLDKFDIDYFSEETTAEIGEEKNIPVDDIDISVYVHEVNDGYLSVEMSNTTDRTYVYGESYYLQVMVDGKWHELSTNYSMNFPYIGYDIEPHEFVDLEIDYYEGYGKLESGTYRLVKEFTYEGGLYSITGEFNIE